MFFFKPFNHAWNPAIYLDSKNTPSLLQNERPFSLHLTLQSDHFIVSVEKCIQLQSRKRAYKINCAPIVLYSVYSVLLHWLTYVNMKINKKTMDRGRYCSVQTKSDDSENVASQNVTTHFSKHFSIS